MAAATYAVVASEAVTLQTAWGPQTYAAGTIVNLVVWDGTSAYDPGPDMRLVIAPAGAAMGQPLPSAS